jgi:putative phosphotransacetylase
MEETALKRLIRNTILTALAGRGVLYLPAAVSARHVHLSREDFEVLFGRGASMTRRRELSQPGQFASGETVEVAPLPAALPAGPPVSGEAGRSLKKVRVLGPERGESQVEISLTDGFVLGLRPPVRMSGDIGGTPGCTLIGPAGRVELKRGVIAAARHIHMSPEQAAAYGVKDGGTVSLVIPGPREGILGGIIVRVGKDFDLEVHLDTDEANGNGILDGTILEARIGSPVDGGCGASTGGVPEAGKPASAAALDLITEREVNAALGRGDKIIYCTARGFISPAAVDRAREKGMELCRLRG